MLVYLMYFSSRRLAILSVIMGGLCFGFGIVLVVLEDSGSGTGGLAYICCGIWIGLYVSNIIKMQISDRQTLANV